MSHTKEQWRLDLHERGGFTIYVHEPARRDGKASGIIILAARNQWNERAAESADNGKLMVRAPRLAAEHEAVAVLLDAYDGGPWHERAAAVMSVLRAAHDAAKEGK